MTPRLRVYAATCRIRRPGDEREGAPDGIGELWFDDPAAMDDVMNGPAMAKAFDDATRFADLERSYPLVVAERVRIE